MKMEQITEIDVSKIFPNPNQPRKEFDKEKLGELAESIKEIGLINPIQVKKIGNKYQLICGERRLKAHTIIKKKKIKALIKNYNSKNEEMIESLVENLHRDDLNSIEKENYVAQLWNTGKYETKVALGKAIGLASTSIMATLEAREARKKTKASKNISTRTLMDTQGLEIEDRKIIFKKVDKKELNSSSVREFSKIVKKSQPEVKKALFSNKVSMKQADSISKISDKKTRQKLITAHKEIKNIDKGLEKSIIKIIPKNENKLIRTRELINSFRQNSLESQKINQITIKSLMKCIHLIPIMDDKQLKQLKYYQELLETNLNNFLELSENIKKNIKSEIF